MVVSPPIIAEPLHACAAAVHVSGVIPGASVEVMVAWSGGTVTAPPVTAIDPDSVVVDVSAVLGRNLVAGDVVTASQSWGLATAVSEPLVVIEPPLDAGVPAPRVAPAPYYRCGQAVGGAGIVPGALFSAHMVQGGSGLECLMGAVDTVATETRFWGPHLDVCPTGDEGLGVFARQEVCGVISADSAFMPIIDPPSSPMTPPEYVGDLYEGQVIVALSRAHFGALVTFTVNGNEEAFPSYSEFARVGQYPLSAALVEGDAITVAQQFCDADQPTRPAVVRACDEMPAPQIQAPGIGERHVDVLVSIPGARIIVFANGVEIGDGGGRRIMLTRPIQAGETIMVVQETTGCRAREMHVTTPACVPRDRLPDPTLAGRFGVGVASYDLPPVTLAGFGAVDVRATVRFPIDSAGGAGELPAWGDPLPLVVIMHGNTDNMMSPAGECTCVESGDVAEHLANGFSLLNPAYTGYLSLMESLARAGIVAVSIDASKLNCIASEPFIDVGAELLLHHLGLWRGWADGTLGNDPLGGASVGRIDLRNVGLIGHSRGGARIPVAVASNSDPDIVIRGALLIAPPSIPGYLWSLDVPMLLIVGANDQDIARQPSWPFYDLATGSLRSQLWLNGAGHYYFNSALWQCDEPSARMAPEQHAAFLAAYGRSFMSAVLLDSDWPNAVGALTGDGRYAHLPSAIGNLSFASSTDFVIDDFEDFGIETNSLGHPVVASGFGDLSEEAVHESVIVGSNYYHETSGAIGYWASGNPEIEEQLGGITSEGYRYVTFRASQPVEERSHYTFDVEIDDGSVAAAISGSGVVDVLPAPQVLGISRPRPTLQGVRVPIACIAAAVGGDIALDNLQALRIAPEDLGTAESAIAIDDIRLQR